jgi:hypothetical protein
VFNSEFNVQLLYLPGLKNVVADFLSRPTPQTHWISRRHIGGRFSGFRGDGRRVTPLPRNAALTGRHISQIGCPPDRHSTWLVTFLPTLSAPLFPSNSEEPFVIIFTTLLTPRGSPPIVLFHSGLCGADFPATSQPGPGVVWPASGARSTATHAWPPNPFPSHNGVFLTFMWIWWAHCSICCDNFNYIFTIIDRTSKCMEAVPLPEMSTAACAKALTFTWISSFGVPVMITLDHGPQFTSNLWLQLCEMLNISHRQTTAYHPESNGAVERLHSRLKDALHARAAAATWSQELPFALLGLRAQPRKDTGLSPSEAVFGPPIVLPNEFLQNEEISVDSIIISFSKTLDVPATSLPRHNSSTQLPSELPAELLSAPLVWVRRGSDIPPLQPLYDSPYAVLRCGPRSFTNGVGSWDEVIAVSCLKA